MWQHDRWTGGHESMKRRLFALVSALSLLVCLGVLVSIAWDKKLLGNQISYINSTSKPGFWGCGVFSAHESIFIGWMKVRYDHPINVEYEWNVHHLGMTFGGYGWNGIWAFAVPMDEDGHLWDHFGYIMSTKTIGDCNCSIIAVMFSKWASVLLSSTLPFVWILFWWRDRTRSRRKGTYSFCSTCRYDLTGNISGVCPECGTRFDRVDAKVRGSTLDI
jgi:hypothetical protein